MLTFKIFNGIKPSYLKAFFHGMLMWLRPAVPLRLGIFLTPSFYAVLSLRSYFAVGCFCNSQIHSKTCCIQGVQTSKARGPRAETVFTLEISSMEIPLLSSTSPLAFPSNSCLNYGQVLSTGTLREVRKSHVWLSHSTTSRFWVFSLARQMRIEFNVSPSYAEWWVGTIQECRAACHLSLANLI